MQLHPNLQTIYMFQVTTSYQHYDGPARVEGRTVVRPIQFEKKKQESQMAFGWTV